MFENFIVVLCSATVVGERKEFPTTLSCSSTLCLLLFRRMFGISRSRHLRQTGSSLGSWLMRALVTRVHFAEGVGSLEAELSLSRENIAADIQSKNARGMMKVNLYNKYAYDYLVLVRWKGVETKARSEKKSLEQNRLRKDT